MKSSNLSHATIYLTASSLLFVVSAYVINVFLGRFLGPVDYGDYGIIIAIMSAINIVQTSGLPQAVSKYVAEEKNDTDQILNRGIILQLISTGIISVVFFLISWPIAYLLSDTNLIPYLQLSSIIFPGYGIYALYVGYYNGSHAFKTQALLGISYSIIKTISIVGLSYYFHIYGAIIGFAISPILALITRFYRLQKSKNSFPYKKLIVFSIPLIGFALLSSLQQSIDLLLVKALSESNSDPGYYTANQNVSRIVFFGLSSFSLILYPSLARSISQQNIMKTRQIIKSSLRYILLLLVPGCLLISATSKELLILIYSSRYMPGANSLSILVIGIGFLTLSTILCNVLNAAGNSKQSVVTTGIGVSTITILCLILIPRFGLDGAAISTTIGSILTAAITSMLVYKKFEQLILTSSIVKILLASGVIYLIANYIHVNPALLPVLYSLLFFFYIILLVLIKEITQQDWKTAKGLLPSWIPIRNDL